MSHDKLLGEEKVMTALMKLSIPATIAMIVNAVFNLVDTIFIGRSEGSVGIAGIAVFLPIQMIIMSLAVMMGIGSASLMSRLLGQKNRELINYVAGNLFIITALISIMSGVGGYVFAEQLLRFFGASETILPYALDYAKAMFLGTTYFPICVASNNLVRAEGNAKDAMNVMIIGMFINIFLDYLFIFTLDMGMWGAGLATSISKFADLLYLIWYFIHKSKVSFGWKYLVPRFDILSEVFAVGFSGFVIQASSSIVATAMNHSLYYYGGDMALSIYGIVFKVTMFLLMPIHGIVQGMQPIIGYSKGAGNNPRIKETLKITLGLTTGLSSTVLIAALVFPELIIRLFSNEEVLIDLGKNVLRIVVLMSPLVGVQMMGVGLFQSIGNGRISLILSVLRQLVLFIPLIYILPRIQDAGIWGIWAAYPIADFVTAAVTMLIGFSYLRSLTHQAELTGQPVSSACRVKP